MAFVTQSLLQGGKTLTESNTAVLLSEELRVHEVNDDVQVLVRQRRDRWQGSIRASLEMAGDLGLTPSLKVLCGLAVPIDLHVAVRRLVNALHHQLVLQQTCQFSGVQMHCRRK